MSNEHKARECAEKVVASVSVEGLGFAQVNILYPEQPSLAGAETVDTIAAIIAPVISAVWDECIAIVKKESVCSCGSGPKFRAFNMRHHTNDCAIHSGMMFCTALEAARDAEQEKAND